MSVVPKSPHSSHSTANLRRNPSGFALIIALVCMGFMVLLVISLSLLSGTELSVSKQQETLSRARSNALLGLNVALGELQKNLGPDQRISATSGINDDATGGRIHWTGAWESNPTGGKAGDFKGWLVSLPNGTSNTEELVEASVGWRETPDGQLQPTSEDWTAMVSNATVDASLAAGAEKTAPLVMAGVVGLDNDGLEGHYAWWVGDEGVKARVNLPQRIAEQGNDVNTRTEQMRALLSPSHYGINKIGTPLQNLTAANANLSRISMLEQISLVDSAASAVAREHFHDLTPHSRGLLTNTRSGGLRHDLTHLFEHNVAFNRQFGGKWNERFIFKAPDATIDFKYGAPNWGTMRSFYQLPSSISSNSLTPIVPSDNPAGAIRPTYTTPEGTAFHTNSPVHPLLAWIQLGVGLEFVVDTSNSVQDVETIYLPILHLRPLVALYNPYDIPLNGRDYRFLLMLSPLIDIQIGDQASVKFRLSEIGTPKTTGDEVDSLLRMYLSANASDLQPGEVRFYGLDKSYPLSESSSQGRLMSDFNESASYTVELSTTQVRTAPKPGSTARQDPNQGSSSDNWGLTVDEKKALIYKHDETLPPEDNPLPGVRVKVSYDIDSPSDPNAEKSARDFGGSIRMHINGPLVTSIYRPYNTELASQRPEDLDQVAPIDQLGGISDLLWFGIGMRTVDSPSATMRHLVDANPRFTSASVVQEGFQRSSRGISTDRGYPVISGWTGNSKRASGSSYNWMETWTDYSPQINNSNRFSGFLGQSRSNSGSGSTILYHVPRVSPRSLGIFQHASLGNYSRHQGYIIGNSYALPRIPTNATQSENYYKYDVSGTTPEPHNAYDWSYAVNLELWDKYYLSGIPQNLQQAQLNAYLDGSRTLPNPRLRLVSVDATEPTIARLTAPGTETTSTTALAHLQLEGPFNINSTSIDAWKSLLASNAGLSIPIYNPTTGVPESDNNESQAVFYRTPINFDDAEDTNDDSSRFWSSYRRLTDTELTNLATSIVAEVKERAPFGSLADFVNRRPSAPNAQVQLQQRGALQAALDKTINDKLTATSSGQAGVKNLDLEIPGLETSHTSAEDRAGTGAPGWILQGDILQAIGPLIAARSDTFIIRAYGDATDMQGNVVARAWCEAVVQRSVKKVDENEDISAADPANGYGRRFNVVSFRWIDAP